ncbi:MAG: phytoene/squalene synthase family protein [Phycisphaeraceae bacterium]
MSSYRGESAAARAVRDAGVKPALPDEVKRSLAWSQRITRQRARNFYCGLKLTPEPKRSALYAIYAFMRSCDDLVDAEDGSDRIGEPQQAIERIEAFREQMHQVIEAPPGRGLPEGELWPGFQQVVQHYPIDPAHLDAMLDGQRLDVCRSRCKDFDQLYDYCYKVASVVGLVCISVWGYDGDVQTRKLAEYRGIAFQLTNILRDVAEDVDRDRVYLPADEMERFGYSADDLRARRGGRAFERLMTYQIERARSYYQMSATLEQHISPDCRSTSWAMTQIYQNLLDRIAERPERVLTKRVRLGGLRKAWIALQALSRGRRAREA